MRRTIEKLRSKPESYRHKVAFLTASTLTLAIFFTWAFAKGFIGLPSGSVAYDGAENTASVAYGAASPMQTSASAFKAAFSHFGDEFHSLKDALANVLVPFISGIEVYQSK